MRRTLSLLGTLTALVAAAPAWGAAPPTPGEPEWIVHPARPGPDLPPVGRSLFDELFATASGYRIPYPFEALRARIGAGLRDDGPRALPQVLIPLGRSLNRNAAAPQFFRFPRVVLAVNEEPPLEAEEGGLLLKYRLFIGYQAKDASLEVISYNDEAGRFEFQVVEGYAAGREPRVRYASRTLCMSCHQNAAPIFPRSPWDETNLNVAVAMRLAAARPDAYDSLVDTISDEAHFIDVATDWANYFAPYQLLWRRGCGGEGAAPGRERAVRCRAAALWAALQFRASGDLAFDEASPRYREDLLGQLSRVWPSRWPGGLYVASADIVDRDPFAARGSAAEDPLYPRPPQAYWPAPAEPIAAGMVTRLAGFLSEGDWLRIERRLTALGAERSLAAHTYRSECRREVGGEVLRFRCGAGPEALGAEVVLRVAQDAVSHARVEGLRMPGAIRLMSASVDGELEREGLGRRFEGRLVGPAAGRAARLADGRRVARLRLRWQDEATPAHIEVEVVDDFSLLEPVIEAMIAQTLRGETDSLTAKPFRRRALIDDLRRHLGMARLAWCCSLPALARPAPQPPDLASTPTPLAVFVSHCGACHGGPSAHPPGFLHGEERAVRRQMAQCAPRILRRLSLWRDDVAHRSHTPMPPPIALGLYHETAGSWPGSAPYRRLWESARELVRRERGAAGLEQSLRIDYEELPACLPTSLATSLNP